MLRLAALVRLITSPSLLNNVNVSVNYVAYVALASVFLASHGESIQPPC